MSRTPSAPACATHSLRAATRSRKIQRLEANDMKFRAALFGGLMLVAASASAQGVFSFEGIPLRGEPSVEVNMDEAMLKLFGGATQESGLEGLTSVRVLVYENVAEDMQGVLKFVESTGTKLES